MKLRFSLKGGLRLYTGGKHYVRVDRCLLALAIVTLIPFFTVKGIICTFGHKDEVKVETQIVEVVKEVAVPLVEAKAIEEPKQEVKEEIKVEESKVKEMNYRMTYYHPNDSTNSGNTTASGLGTKDFQLNENGWYTYKGKLVVATAHNSLKSWNAYKGSTQKTYKLYDELTINIKGKDYDAIVLDKCGACMKSAKIDLFVKDGAHGLDTSITVVEK